MKAFDLFAKKISKPFKIPKFDLKRYNFKRTDSFFRRNFQGFILMGSWKLHIKSVNKITTNGNSPENQLMQKQVIDVTSGCIKGVLSEDGPNLSANFQSKDRGHKVTSLNVFVDFQGTRKSLIVMYVHNIFAYLSGNAIKYLTYCSVVLWYIFSIALFSVCISILSTLLFNPACI